MGMSGPGHSQVQGRGPTWRPAWGVEEDSGSSRPGTSAHHSGRPLGETEAHHYKQDLTQGRWGSGPRGSKASVSSTRFQSDAWDLWTPGWNGGHGGGAVGSVLEEGEGPHPGGECGPSEHA